MVKKELLFSVSIKDCEVQTFRSGKPGGQNQNKRDTGVRVIHKESGARGEARDSRTQEQNKKNAFLRMINTNEFKTWHKIKTAEAYGRPSLKELVTKEMEPSKLKVEIKDQNGNWVKDSS